MCQLEHFIAQIRQPFTWNVRMCDQAKKICWYNKTIGDGADLDYSVLGTSTFAIVIAIALTHTLKQKEEKKLVSDAVILWPLICAFTPELISVKCLFVQTHTDDASQNAHAELNLHPHTHHLLLNKQCWVGSLEILQTLGSFVRPSFKSRDTNQRLC